MFQLILRTGNKLGLHTGAKTNIFNPEFTKNLMFEKCEFCEKSGFEVKNETLHNVNFVKNATLKM